MNFKEMETKIETAAAKEREAGLLHHSMKHLVARSKVKLSDMEINSLRSIIQSYVGGVPRIWDEVSFAAKKRGIWFRISPILDVLTKYIQYSPFSHPEQLGLLGLVDNVYLIRGVLQYLNNECRRLTGKPLVDESIETQRFVMTSILGRRLVNRLDKILTEILTSSKVKRALAALDDFADEFIMVGKKIEKVKSSKYIKEINSLSLAAS